jgi:hypothetical protein
MVQKVTNLSGNKRRIGLILGDGVHLSILSQQFELEAKDVIEDGPDIRGFFPYIGWSVLPVFARGQACELERVFE